MGAALVLMAAAALLGLAAGLEALAARRGSRPRDLRRALEPHEALPPFAARMGLAARIARSGMAARLTVPVLLMLKLVSACTGMLVGIAAAPAAPGRLSFVVALGLPVAGFVAPDAWLERRARARLRSLRAALPDALDLLAVGASAGRSPVAAMGEIGTGDGPLARELAVLAAESSCGAPQRAVLGSLRERVPISEVAGLCGVIERSHRYGSPLAEQLSEQARSQRAAQRRRIEEQAAKAAPKIQLAVALLLVPSVLLMIAAGLLANVDRFLAGL